MLTRRGLFKTVAALGLGAMLPSKTFGELPAMAQISSRRDSQRPSSACQPASQDRPGESTSLCEIETRDELLDSVDCMELAEQYGSFLKVGGYLGGFLAGHCLFCRAGTCYVHPNEFRCDECDAAGTALGFFAKMERITDQEAVPRLAMLVKSGSLQRRRNEQTVLWGIMSEASRYYHRLLCDTAEGEPAREWLKEQGVTLRVREKLYLGYFPHCRNGIQTELIDLLVNRGYEPDIVQSAILPVGYPGIVLPIRDDQGHWWGFLTRSLRSEEEVLYYSSLLGMRRLAPRLCSKLPSRSGSSPGSLAHTVITHDPPDD
jgi:hypothetical protein